MLSRVLVTPTRSFGRSTKPRSSYWSVMFRCSLAGWRLVPRVSFHTELIAVVEQPFHIGGVELFVVQIVEVRPDVRQVEICPVLLGGGIDPSQIIDPLRLNQRTDSPSADVHGAALHSGPLRLQLSVANDVGMKLAVKGFSCSSA